METVPSPTLPLTMGTVTTSVGRANKRMPNLADPPASVVMALFGAITWMAGASLSRLTKSTSLGSMGVKAGSPSGGSIMIRYARAPSATVSSTPVTVTFCGAFQSVTVKTRRAGLTVPSVMSELRMAMVTSAFGCALSTTLNCAVAPFSLVARPGAANTVTPAVSLSKLMTGTSSGFKLL